MLHLSPGSPIIFKRAHCKLTDFRRHGYIVRVADPEVAVYILRLDVRNELLPCFLLVVEDLLGFFGAEGR